MNILTLVKAAIVLVAGTAVGYFLRQLIAQQRKDALELKAKQILLDAKENAQKTLDEAKARADKIVEAAKAEEKNREKELRRTEERLAHKDEILEKKSAELDKETSNLQEKFEKVKAIKEQLEKIEIEKKEELARVAKLTEEEAKNKIVEEVEKKYEKDILARVQKIEQFGIETLEKKARDILASVIQRDASSTASEVTVTSVAIPSDDLKGKIIGKEGRNIRAFERAAGVELIVDDTPGVILISSFDPVRRQIARVALENLILDGRVQPAKIEETVGKAKEDINKIIKEKGEQACYECGVINMDPRLISILGRLYFRTSYGQNVLQHSIEMAHISAMLAEE